MLEIFNRAPHLVIVPCKSGKNIYLAPGERSCLIDDFETNGNKKIEKLLKANLISINRLTQKKQEVEVAAKKAQTTSTKESNEAKESKSKKGKEHSLKS